MYADYVEAFDIPLRPHRPVTRKMANGGNDMVRQRTESLPESSVSVALREPLMLKPPEHLYVAFGCGGEKLVVDEITGHLTDRHPAILDPEEGDIAQPVP
jgi:hypothetical protein